MDACMGDVVVVVAGSTSIWGGKKGRITCDGESGTLFRCSCSSHLRFLDHTFMFMDDDDV